MKLYLHGPREGQNITIKGVQFVNGVAEHHCLPVTLERKYGVKNYALESLTSTIAEITEDINSTPSTEELEVKYDSLDKFATSVDDDLATEDGHRELQALIEEKKREFIQPEKLKNYKYFNNMGGFQAYVDQVTGLRPRTKKQGNDYLTKFAEDNNLIFEAD